MTVLKFSLHPFQTKCQYHNIEYQKNKPHTITESDHLPFTWCGCPLRQIPFNVNFQMIKCRPADIIFINIMETQEINKRKNHDNHAECKNDHQQHFGLFHFRSIEDSLKKIKINLHFFTPHCQPRLGLYHYHHPFRVTIHRNENLNVSGWFGKGLKPF